MIGNGGELTDLPVIDTVRMKWQSLFIINFHSHIGIVGGVESNWVHSALRSLTGLLCQPWVIMMMEKLVEWLPGETEVLGENLPQCRFVPPQTPQAARTRTRAVAVGSQRLTAWATARTFCSHIRRWLISLWLYKEIKKLRGWKYIFTLHIPPWAPHTYDFVFLISLTHQK
jgi:hypothetical protein